MNRVRKLAYASLGLVVPAAAVAYGLLPASAATAGPISGLGGKCIDVAGAAAVNGAAIQIYDCNGSAAQQWSVGNADGTLRALGKCMDVTSASTTNGAKIQLYDCNATGAQKWTVSNGALVNTGSGKCLDVTGKSATNGTRLQIWTCTNTTNQTWTMPGGTTTPTSAPTSAPSGKSLDDPAKKDVAMQIVSAAENSSLN
jgi:chitosanase